MGPSASELGTLSPELWFNWNQAGLGPLNPEDRALACGWETWGLVLPPPSSQGRQRKPFLSGPRWRLLEQVLLPSVAAEGLRILQRPIPDP